MNAPSTALCISATERWADARMVRVEMSYLARGLTRGLTDSASACGGALILPTMCLKKKSVIARVPESIAYI
jgi:hypothetical protein